MALESTVLSPGVIAKLKEFKRPFMDQFDSIERALIRCTSDYPIALCALYGSMLKGLSRHSDIDILVLLRDDYKSYGDILDVKIGLEDRIAAAAVNSIPVDLKVSSVSSFLDMSRGTEFKRSVSANNEVFWEDGVSIGREYFRGI